MENKFSFSLSLWKIDSERFALNYFYDKEFRVLWKKILEGPSNCFSIHIFSLWEMSKKAKHVGAISIKWFT